MLLQEIATPANSSAILMIGSGTLGAIVGLFLASSISIKNRSGFHLNDLIGVIVLVLGGATIALFPVSTDVFVIYGIGVFIGIGMIVIYRLFMDNDDRYLKSQIVNDKENVSLENVDQQVAINGLQFNINLAGFRKLLLNRFNHEELESLCFDLGIVYENLPGESKNQKVIELINYMNRRGELPKLIQAVRDDRPSASWEKILS